MKVNIQACLAALLIPCANGALNVNSGGQPNGTSGTSLTYEVTTAAAQVGTGTVVPGASVILNSLTSGVTISQENQFAMVFSIDQATTDFQISLQLPFVLDDSGGIYNDDGTLTAGSGRLLRTGFRVDSDFTEFNTLSYGIDVDVEARLDGVTIKDVPVFSTATDDYQLVESPGLTEYSYQQDDTVIEGGILRHSYGISATGEPSIYLDEFVYTVSVSDGSVIPAGTSFRVTFDGGNFQAIPEPSTWVFGLSVLAVFSGYRRRA